MKGILYIITGLWVLSIIGTLGGVIFIPFVIYAILIFDFVINGQFNSQAFLIATGIIIWLILGFKISMYYFQNYDK